MKSAQAPNHRRHPLWMKRRERVARLVNEVQKELHWDAYQLRQPEAARAALPAILRIVDEELTAYVRGKP
jgi:hypothetical protein